MAKYTKINEEIEAVQWSGNNYSEILSLVDPGGGDRRRVEVTFDFNTRKVTVKENGWVTCARGDWLIKTENDNFLKLDNKEFITHYRPLEGF